MPDDERELINLKVREQQRFSQDQQLYLLNRITWDAREIALKQARRVGPASGHVVLSLALDEVIDWIYVHQGRLIPNRKWKLFQLGALNMVTDEQLRLVLDVLRCNPTSLADLERRIGSLAALCDGLGIPRDATSIEITRKSYQTSKQLLGEHAAPCGTLHQHASWLTTAQSAAR